MNQNENNRKVPGFVLSSHSRKVKLYESIAKNTLWIAAGITMGTLFIIIGYILFRGFYLDMRIQDTVIPRGSSSVSLDNYPEEKAVVIANREVRIEELTLSQLRDVFTGDIDNWGSLSEQDIDVNVLVNENGSGKIIEGFVFGEEPDFYENVDFLDDDSAIIDSVASKAGSIGVISYSNLSLLRGQNAKVLNIRWISVTTNPKALESEAGTSIRYLTEEQLQGIFLGNYRNWSELGGADLPIVIAAFPEDSNLRVEFERSLLGEENKIFAVDQIVNSPDELADFLRNNNGSIGFIGYNDTLAEEFEFLSVEKRITGLNLDTFFITEAPRRAGRVGGISTIILNTLFMIFLTIILAGPIGIAAAVYLTEYAKQGVLNEILRFGTETLAGVPSIIFGLFGFILFVMHFQLGVGLLSGTLTITFMILPTIIRASEEALKSVPQTLRESSLALGATKLQTVLRVVVPAASPGIMTGLILAIGRAVGETAALLFTMGSDYRLARDFLSSARVMSVHLYILVREGISFERAFATATILIIIILLINFATNKLISRMIKMHG